MAEVAADTEVAAAADTAAAAAEIVTEAEVQFFLEDVRDISVP